MGFQGAVRKAIRMIHGVLLQRKQFMQLVVKLLPQMHRLAWLSRSSLAKAAATCTHHGHGIVQRRA